MKKEPPKYQYQKQIALFLLDFIQSLVIALTIYVVLYHYVAQPQLVVSISMEPTFIEGDRLIVEKLSYRFGAPKRGDIIVFQFPDNPEIMLVKRVIGLPGETIEIQENKLYINDVLLSETYTKELDSTVGGTELKENGSFIIPENEYVVLGDNREKSSDSRLWGTITREHIIGKVFMRMWPLYKIGVIESPIYS